MRCNSVCQKMNLLFLLHAPRGSSTLDLHGVQGPIIRLTNDDHDLLHMLTSNQASFSLGILYKSPRQSSVMRISDVPRICSKFAKSRFWLKDALVTSFLALVSFPWSLTTSLQRIFRIHGISTAMMYSSYLSRSAISKRFEAVTGARYFS